MEIIELSKNYQGVKDFVNSIITVKHNSKELCVSKCIVQFLANNNWHIKLGNSLILEFVENKTGVGSWKIA